MPLGGSILKLRGLWWGNSSWAWPHGLGMSPHTHGLCPSYSTEDKVIVNLNIHRWQGEGGWEGFLHPILKSGEILSLYGSKIIPLSSFVWRIFMNIRYPPYTVGIFLGLLHIGLQLQCYLEGDCGKPWVMASKCNVVIKVVCVLGGKC